MSKRVRRKVFRALVFWAIFNTVFHDKFNLWEAFLVGALIGAYTFFVYMDGLKEGTKNVRS